LFIYKNPPLIFAVGESASLYQRRIFLVSKDFLIPPAELVVICAKADKKSGILQATQDTA